MSFLMFFHNQLLLVKKDKFVEPDRWCLDHQSSSSSILPFMFMFIFVFMLVFILLLLLLLLLLMF